MRARRMLNKRFSLIVIFVGSISIFILFNVMTKVSEHFCQLRQFELVREPDERPAQIRCYDEFSTNESFPELNASRERELRLGSRRNIFFLETSCFAEEGYARLNYRQACSVESAARANPGMMVNLLYLSPAPPSNLTKRLVDHLFTYENVRVYRVRVAEFIRGTPIENWYSGGRILAQSSWPAIHASDFFRLLTLWKYGGIFLDLDVVVMKSFDELINFVGYHSSKVANTAIMGLNATGLGFEVVSQCLRDLMDTYRGNKWDGSSVGLLTRVVQNLCATKNLEEMTLDRCQGLKVLPPSVLHPIHWTQPSRLFRTKDSTETMKLINAARTVHMWNSMTKNVEVQEGSPYAQVAEKYCPLIYNHRDGKF